MRIPIIPEKSPSSKKQNIAKSLRGLGENIAGSAVKGSKEIMGFAKDVIKNLNSEEFKTTAMVALLSATAMILGSDEKPDTSSGTTKDQIKDPYEEPATTQPYAESTSELRQQVGPAPSYSQQPRQIDENPTPNKNYTSDEKVVKRLDKYREQRDGLAILDYSGNICQQFDIPLSVFREMVNVESSWNPKVKNRISSATGLGQFLDSSWRYFMAYCKRKNIHDPKWGPKPLTLNHRYNPYCSIYATAWAMRQTKKDSTLGKLINASPPHIQGKIYYLAHHEGVAGAKKYLKFLEIMQSEGHVSKTAVLAVYNANPNRYNRILHSSQIRRIKRSGIKSFLSIYFTLCTRISSKVYASNNPDSTQRVAKREVREIAGSIEKHPASDTIVVGDSYAQGLMGAGGLKSAFSEMKSVFRHSTSTRHFIALLKDIKNKLLPLSRRNELIALIKNAKSIFLKLGQKGSIGYFNGKVKTQKALPTSVKDTVGAGDAFNAGIIYGMIKGYDLEKILKISTAISSYVISRDEDRYPNYNQLSKVLRKYSISKKEKN